MKNKGLKILLCVLLVLCVIMAGALIGKEYIGDNIKEAANRNGVDAQRVHSLMQPKLRQQKRIHKSHRCQP